MIAGLLAFGLSGTVRDAVEGHVTDITERVTVADEVASGDVLTTASPASKSSLSCTYFFPSISTIDTEPLTQCAASLPGSSSRKSEYAINIPSTC